VWAWGENRNGQLGTGDELGDAGVPGQTTQHTPVKVGGVSGARQVAASAQGSTVLLGDGSVMAWGTNPGDGTDTSLSPVRVLNIAGIRAIASGDLFSVALRSDGTVWTWGSNDNGQLGDGSTTDRLSPGQVQGLTGVTAIAAGGHHVLAVKSDGSVWSWGWNRDGELGNDTSTDRGTPGQVSGLSGVKGVAAGEHFSLAVKTDGTVWGWGSNAYGQIADAPLTVCGIASCRTTPYQIPGLSSISSVAAGSAHSLALTRDGQVFAWGFNQYGQLGRGTSGSANATSPTPELIDELGIATQISGGLYHTMITVSDALAITS
jgi:alpha-tubulin suppressor-like RCC1 family protein